MHLRSSGHTKFTGSKLEPKVFPDSTISQENTNHCNIKLHAPHVHVSTTFYRVGNKRKGNKDAPSRKPAHASEQAAMFKDEIAALHSDGDWSDFGPKNLVQSVLICLFGAPTAKV